MHMDYPEKKFKEYAPETMTLRDDYLSRWTKAFEIKIKPNYDIDGPKLGYIVLQDSGNTATDVEMSAYTLESPIDTSSRVFDVRAYQYSSGKDRFTSIAQMPIEGDPYGHKLFVACHQAIDFDYDYSTGSYKNPNGLSEAKADCYVAVEKEQETESTLGGSVLSNIGITAVLAKDGKQISDIQSAVGTNPFAAGVSSADSSKIIASGDFSGESKDITIKVNREVSVAAGPSLPKTLTNFEISTVAGVSRVVQENGTNVLEFDFSQVTEGGNTRWAIG